MSTSQDPEFLANKESEEAQATEQQAGRNLKILMWVIVAVAAIALIVLCYIMFIQKPNHEAAINAIAKADMSLSMNQDSLALQQYKAVADDYGFEAGNRAALQAAIILYQQAQNDTSLYKTNLPEAIKYLEKYDPQESIIGAASRSLMGDCYANLGQLDKARSCFAQATKLSDNNPAYTPFFMMKEANIDRALGDYAAEAALYKAIQERFPMYGASQNIDIEKYIQRAESSESK